MQGLQLLRRCSVTYGAGVQPIGCRLSSQTRAYSLAVVCRFLVSTLIIHVITLDYYSFTDPVGMEGWVGLVVDP